MNKKNIPNNIESEKTLKTDYKEILKINDLNEKSKENIQNKKTLKILYSEILRAYDLNEKSKEHVQNKANGIIIFNSAVITLIILASVQILNIPHFKNIQFLILIIIIPLILLIFSLKKAINSYTPKNYPGIDIDEIYEDFKNEDEIILLEKLSGKKIEYLDEHDKTSNENADFLEISMKYLMLGMISLVICFIILITAIAFYPQLQQLFILLNP